MRIRECGDGQRARTHWESERSVLQPGNSAGRRRGMSSLGPEIIDHCRKEEGNQPAGKVLRTMDSHSRRRRLLRRQRLGSRECGGRGRKVRTCAWCRGLSRDHQQESEYLNRRPIQVCQDVSQQQIGDLDALSLEDVRDTHRLLRSVVLQRSIGDMTVASGSCSETVSLGFNHSRQHRLVVLTTAIS